MIGKLAPPRLAPGAFARFTQGGGPVPLGVGYVVVISASAAVCVSSSSAVAVVS
jgi:hypothetical protein